MDGMQSVSDEAPNFDLRDSWMELLLAATLSEQVIRENPAGSGSG